MNSEAVMGIVSGLSNLATAVIAGYGLLTWRMQYRTQINFELARNLTRATTKVEAAIRGVRAAASLYDHMGEEDSDQTEKKRRLAKLRVILQDDHAKFRQALDELEDAGREAEMVWGGQAVEKAMLYFAAIDNELWLAVYHLSGQASVDGPEQSQEAQKYLQKLRREPGKDDPFETEIKNAVQRIKAVADPHLKL